MYNEPSIQDPFGEFRIQCKRVLHSALNILYGNSYDYIPLSLEIPPSIEFGDLASTICFEISKKTKGKPYDISLKIINKIDHSDAYLIHSVDSKGGYLNFSLNYDELTKITLNSIRKLKEYYGFLKTKNGEKIIVEHSSFNPIHAIHIGQGRSPVLGDSLYRILKKRGHKVSRHFYIDDTGRQSAIIAYGYKMLNQIKPLIKPDHYMGQIYSVMNCLLEIKRLKDIISKSKNATEVSETKKTLKEWTEISDGLKIKHPEFFKKLERSINEKDSEYEISKLLKQYESGDRNSKELIRQVSILCIEGFKQTLASMEIGFDSWDWESELIWSGEVEKVLQKLQKTNYASKINGVIKLNAEKVTEDFELRESLGLTEEYEIPPLVLTRSDGTSLYVTRDIAYSLKKFELANRVINVIGSEQKLAQLHVKIALCALGFKKFALRQSHYAFGLVEFPQYKMSSRRGRIIPLDQVIDKTIKIALEKVSGNSKSISDKEREEIAKIISISAIKYALLSIEPSKNVVFTWDKVLNLKRNSAPFINYAYTRAKGILKKIGAIPEIIDQSLLIEPVEHKLIFHLSRFPETFVEACENLRPDIIANYANLLAEGFHEYYEKVDVSHVKDDKLKYARSALVDSIQICLRNAMGVLGIKLSEKM